jgi:hypothetical protein
MSAPGRPASCTRTTPCSWCGAATVRSRSRSPAATCDAPPCSSPRQAALGVADARHPPVHVGGRDPVPPIRAVDADQAGRGGTSRRSRPDRRRNRGGLQRRRALQPNVSRDVRAQSFARAPGRRDHRTRLALVRRTRPCSLARSSRHDSRCGPDGLSGVRPDLGQPPTSLKLFRDL